MTREQSKDSFVDHYYQKKNDMKFLSIVLRVLIEAFNFKQIIRRPNSIDSLSIFFREY